MRIVIVFQQICHFHHLSFLPHQVLPWVTTDIILHKIQNVLGPGIISRINSDQALVIIKVIINFLNWNIYVHSNMQTGYFLMFAATTLIRIVPTSKIWRSFTMCDLLKH